VLHCAAGLRRHHKLPLRVKPFHEHVPSWAVPPGYGPVAVEGMPLRMLWGRLLNVSSSTLCMRAAGHGERRRQAGGADAGGRRHGTSGQVHQAAPGAMCSKHNLSARYTCFGQLHSVCSSCVRHSRTCSAYDRAVNTMASQEWDIRQPVGHAL
jgi:hypothetical protein